MSRYRWECSPAAIVRFDFVVERQLAKLGNQPQWPPITRRRSPSCASRLRPRCLPSPPCCKTSVRPLGDCVLQITLLQRMEQPVRRSCANKTRCTDGVTLANERTASSTRLPCFASPDRMNKGRAHAKRFDQTSITSRRQRSKTDTKRPHAARRLPGSDGLSRRRQRDDASVGSADDVQTSLGVQYAVGLCVIPKVPVQRAFAVEFCGEVCPSTLDAS